MVGIGDFPAPSQDTEVTDLQEQKINAQASVAEAENAVIISCLLVIAFRACQQKICELIFIWEQVSRCSSLRVVSLQATVKIQATFRGYWQRVSPALGGTLVLEHNGSPTAYFR